MSTPTEQQIKDLCALYGVYPERLPSTAEINDKAIGWVVKRYDLPKPPKANGPMVCFYMTEPSDMKQWVECVVYYSKKWDES